MPELTTKFGGYHKKIRREAMLDAKLVKFLGKGEIDHANQGLRDSMEVEEENSMRSYIGKTVDDKMKRLTSKEKAEQRKNFPANITNQESPPTKNG